MGQMVPTNGLTRVEKGGSHFFWKSAWVLTPLVCVGIGSVAEPMQQSSLYVGAGPIQEPPHTSSSLAGIRLFENVIDAEQFEAIRESLSLTNAVTAAFDQRFALYTTSIHSLHTRVLQQVREAGLDEIVASDRTLQSLGGGERAASLNRAMWAHATAGRVKADALLAELATDLRSMLTSAEALAFDGAMRTWRREAMLNIPRNPAKWIDLRQHPDLVILAREALAATGELALIGSSLDRRQPITHRHVVAADMVRDAICRYELEIDDLLRSNATSQFDAQQRLREAFMKGDIPEAERSFQASMTAWRKVYDRTMHAVRDIQQLAADALGAEAASRWKRRVENAYYPATCAQTSVELMCAWMTSSGAVSDAHDELVRTIAAIDLAHAQFRARSMHLSLNERMTQSMYLGNFDPGHPTADRATLDSEWREYVEKANRELRSLLDSGSQSMFDAALQRTLNSPHNGVQVRF